MHPHDSIIESSILTFFPRKIFIIHLSKTSAIFSLSSGSCHRIPLVIASILGTFYFQPTARDHRGPSSATFRMKFKFYILHAVFLGYLFSVSDGLVSVLTWIATALFVWSLFDYEKGGKPKVAILKAFSFLLVCALASFVYSAIFDWRLNYQS